MTWAANTGAQIVRPTISAYPTIRTSRMDHPCDGEFEDPIPSTSTRGAQGGSNFRRSSGRTRPSSRRSDHSSDSPCAVGRPSDHAFHGGPHEHPALAEE